MNSQSFALRVLVLASLAVLAGGASPAQGAPRDPSADTPEALGPALAAQLEEALQAPFLAKAQVGVHAVDLETGKVLFAHGSELPLNPASNVKLVTTAAALALLGPEYRYPTRLYHGADAFVGGVIKGDLYLRGSGDPDLVTEDLIAVAGELRARGVARITGGIVIDSSRFDHDGLPPGYDQKDELAAYRAPIGATAVNFNTFVLHVRPAAAVGTAPGVAIDPPVTGIRLMNEATTVAGTRPVLSVEIEHEKRTTLKLRGTIGIAAGAKNYRYPVDDPSRYAGEVLAVALRSRGIKLGRTRVKTGEVPKDARLLATHWSDPLGVLIRAVNKYSNNYMAEQILKTLAPPDAPATAETALARVRAELERFGVATSGVQLGNGSGLYDTNRVTAQAITDLLAVMYTDFRYRGDYLASLAVMGVDGTVRRRLKDSDAKRWVRVKTGTLDGISALSGYAGAPGRDPIVFSVVFNGLRRFDSHRARGVQDRVAELLARHAGGKPLVDPVEGGAAAAAQ